MLAAHKCCPKCSTFVEENSIYCTMNLCPKCSANLLVDISEDELDRYKHRYRIVDTSKFREPTAEDRAIFDEAQSLLEKSKDRKWFFESKKGSILKFMSTPVFLWAGFFLLITIAMLIFMFTTYSWYTLIPVIGLTLIHQFVKRRS